MSDQEKGSAVQHKTLTKKRAIAVMLTGALLFVLALVLPAQPGTSLYYIRLGIGTIGLVVVCVGAYLRPMTPEKKK